MIFIILHHIYQYTASRYGVYYPLPLGVILQAMGYLATGVFFLISGYGLYSSIKKNEPLNRRYIFVHLLKLYLPFLFVNIIFAILQLCQGDFNIWEWLRKVLLIEGFWFMRTIFLVYLCVFLVWCLHFSTRTKVYIISIGILLYAILSKFAFDASTVWWNSILCFPLGMICAHNKDKVQNLNTRTNGAIIFLIFIFSFISYYIFRSHYCPECLREVGSTFCMMLSSLSLSLYAIRFVSIVNIKNRIFFYVGTNSLCFYLFQYIFLPLPPFKSPIIFFFVVWIGVVIVTFAYKKLYDITLKNSLESH